MFDGHEPIDDNIDQRTDRIEMDIVHRSDLPKLAKQINKRFIDIVFRGKETY